MDAEVSYPDKLEAHADRVRGQIGETLEVLRAKLTPRNLVEDWADRSGVRDLTPSSVVDFAVRKHPVACVLAGLAIGLGAFSALRSSPDGGSGVVGRAIGDFSRSARETLKERVRAKRVEVTRAVEGRLWAGADHLSDAVEKGVGELVSRAPAPPEAKPLIESAVLLILVAAFETWLERART